MSAQNKNLSADEEYNFFLYYMRSNSPEDVKYVEESFQKDWYFKPYYQTGFDGKPNGFIDNPYTKNLSARQAMGLEPLGIRFGAPSNPPPQGSTFFGMTDEELKKYVPNW